MKLEFNLHSEEAIFKRTINVDDIRRVILNPDHRENSFDGRVKVQKTIDEKTLRVVYFKKHLLTNKTNTYRIISIYYL